MHTVINYSFNGAKHLLVRKMTMNTMRDTMTTSPTPISRVTNTSDPAGTSLDNKLLTTGADERPVRTYTCTCTTEYTLLIRTAYEFFCFFLISESF